MKSQMQWLRYSREQLHMLVFSGLVAVSVKADSFALHSQRSQTRTINNLACENITDKSILIENGTPTH